MKKSEWYNESIQKVNNLNTIMGKKEVRRFRLSLLIKMITRIEEFSLQACDHCEKYKSDIDQLITMLKKNQEDRPTDIKEFRTTFNRILKHLTKDHGLVEEGIYMNQWMIYGLALGVLFMSIYVYSISIGLIMGIAIGSMLDADAKKKGKQI